MTDEPLLLSAIDRNPNLFVQVSEQLLAAIREAKLEPGSRIPSERDLGERFGVSRTVVREAIRHLAAKGVLEARSGHGVRVADLQHEGVAESIELFLSQRGTIEPHKIDEVRQTLELATVRLAAERADDEQLASIVALVDRADTLLDDPEELSRADVAFHRAIVEATDNALFLVLMDSLADVLLQLRRATLADHDRAVQAVAEHRRIADALARRDVEGAVAAMRDHLADSLDAFRHAIED